MLPYLAKAQPFIQSLLPENWIKELSGSVQEGESQSVLDEVEVKEKPSSKAQENTSYDKADLQGMDSLIEGIE